MFCLSGLCNGMIDVLNKHFQNTLNVSKAQSALVQGFWYVGYFLLALPAGMFARSDGTAAMRLSVSIVSVVENTLLNARVTTVCCIRPVWAMSMPPVDRRWSIGVTAGRPAIVTQDGKRLRIDEIL